MNIYTVEIHGKNTSYIGIQVCESELNAAVQTAEDIMVSERKRFYDLSPGVITMHPTIGKAIRYYKKNHQGHKLIDPYRVFSSYTEKP